MKDSLLFQQINFDKAYRKNRLNAALWVLENPKYIRELLEFCFLPEQIDITHKATWVLEFVCLKEISLLYRHFDYFFKNLSLIKKDQSVRPLAHICELLTLRYYKKREPEFRVVFSTKHKELMIETAFDWMITNQKVACQARAMTTLYFLGTEFNWIHPELHQIIKQNLPNGSAGYKARGNATLALIEKFGP